MGDFGPIAGFNATTFSTTFDAAVEEVQSGGKPAFWFFPEGANCSVCVDNELFSHLSSVMYCCGKAICKVLFKLLTKMLKFRCLRGKSVWVIHAS